MSGARATEHVELVFDTYAWIELLGDGPRAADVEALHVAHEVGTPTLVYAELAHLYETRDPASRERAVEAVASTSLRLELTQEIAVAAGRTRARLAGTRKGIGLVDCLVLETARAHDARLVTGDPHLKGLEGVVFLG